MTGRVTDNCCRLALLSFLSFLLINFYGCVPSASKRTAATNWSVTKQVSKEEDRQLELVVLGQTDCPYGAKRAIEKAFNNASNCPIEEQALRFAALGIAAVHRGALQEAENALDEALSIMEANITDQGKLDEVISLRGSEKSKIFKGEPYERVMCLLYRGIVYLAKGDYDNARACFKSAQLQDAKIDAESKAEFGRWVSLEYLTFITDRLGDKASEASFPTEIPDELAIGDFNEGDDSVLIVAAGLTPIKIQEQIEKGKYGLSYNPVSSRVSSIKIYRECDYEALPQDDGALTLRPLTAIGRPSEDIFIQAVSHGRRSMDGVLRAKRRIKDSAEKTGDVAEGIGVALAQIGGTYAMPLVFIAAGVSAHQRRKAAKADSVADLRQIMNIPGELYLTSVKAHESPLVLQALDSGGNEICSKKISIPVIQDTRPKVVLVRIYQ